MEATLQKSKAKKHRTKNKQTSSVELCLVNDRPKCDKFVKSQDEKKSPEINLEEKVNSAKPKAEPPETAMNELSITNFCTKDLENHTEREIHDKNFENISSNEICERHNRGNSEETLPSETSVNDVHSSERMSIKLQQNAAKPHSLHVYPDLKILERCEEMHNIISSQTLVKTTAERYKTKTAIEANKAFEEFIKVIHDLDKHPLTDMIHEYHRVKKASLYWRSRIKYLKSHLKRNKDSLWRSVKKQTSAKGKCEDGYNVTVTHIFTIKELDEDKFNEVIKILHEIEELLLSDAFHSYSEEVMRLRIDHYIYELIENEKGFPGELSGNQSVSLKKCISVLFEAERQNVRDKHYLNICQNWLKTLVSNLTKKKSCFEDNMFLINHVIRCPNGIQTWAPELIHVPIDINETENNDVLDSICAEQILLALYLILNPVPLKEFFLKNIPLTEKPSTDAKFTCLDSEGEEEELFEMSKNLSDSDVSSLLNQIPVRSLYKHFLLDGKLNLKIQSKGMLLKLFAYSTAIIDVLFTGLETYHLESFELFFENISNLIRHILLYISKYWTHSVIMNSLFKPEIQAVYDKLFFHIVFKAYNFEKLHFTWKILPALPYDHISEKMLWSIMWIFFCPERSEDQIYSEKDVEIKIKEGSVLTALINHIRNLPVHDIFHLLSTIEKIIMSSNSDKDFIKFSYHIIFEVCLESSLKEQLSNEGIIILTSIAEKYPYLVSVLLKKIDETCDTVAGHCISFFKKLDISNWIPEKSDLCLISGWLLSNLSCGKNQLACLILKNMNWDYNEEGVLFLSYDLHKQVALIVTEAYVKSDANNSNEGMISKGVKQMLQFTSMGSQRIEEEFVQWAWNILFLLKLHPLDRKIPPWVQIYEGCLEEREEDFFTKSNDLFTPLLSAYENKHPSICYLMLVMANEGRSMKNLINGGLECFTALVESEQYMAAIKSLFYILPFFVKNSEELLEKSEFIKAISNLISADLTVMSNITGEPVIGAVLHKIAAIIKFQIYQAAEQTIEFAAPLLTLWIKILMKILSLLDGSSTNILKNSATQIHFLLDVLVKIAFLHDYTRECTLDLLNSYCNPLILPKAPQPSIFNRIFNLNWSTYAVLNRCTIPEYPWLAWYVLFSEMKQKNVQDVWLKIQIEMMKQADGSSFSHLKNICHSMKVDLEFLPIFRWALQAVETPVSHPICPLLWQQFFLYYFQRVPMPNSENYASVGIKYFKNGQFAVLFKKIKKSLSETVNFYRNLRKAESESKCIQASEEFNSNKYGNGSSFYLNLERLFEAFQLYIENESLHQPGLCLSALEPKYCPHRLKLLVNGDQRIWFDMISTSSLKDEIELKVHTWHFSKKNSQIKRKLNESHFENESLPEQIKRHIEMYENVLSAVKTKPASVVAIEKNGLNLTSKQAIVELIERNQSLIFDKAQYFCEQMRKLKQLNFNFIEWTPQEYEIEDCEFSEMKLCHKGSGANGCSGAAHFKLQIQKCRKNEIISERIENNRADYLIVQDQLVKLPLKDLCISSLHIENCIRLLASKIKEAHTSEDAEYFRKLGIALFYHQLSTIDKAIATVADYPPSRQFFSSIIELLGREFLDGDETELTQLAKSILNHPESGILALPLFNPSKCGIQNFLGVYKTLTSSVGGNSASTLLALFSKIDFSQWLNEYAPSFDDRKIIFNCICDALLACGQIPSSELLPVFEILKRHFGIILQYMFPDLFLTAVGFLLKGIEHGNLSVAVYYEAFHRFGCPLFNDKSSVEDIEFALRKFAENQQLPTDQQIFVSVVQLNLEQVSYVSSIFYSHFFKKRLNSALYKKYSAYIKPLGIFLAIISHSLIALHLERISNANVLCISDLWETFHSPFWPFLHPIANSSGLDFPFTEIEEELIHARYIFKIFICSLKYFHEKFFCLRAEENVISYVWNSYVEIYVTPGFRNYSVSLCHSELLNLPFHQFHPSTRDIEGMCKVLQSSLQESKEFLSKISVKIPWLEVMQTISLTKPPDYVAKVLATLGKLLIISQLDCAEVESNVYPKILKDMENLTWNFLSYEDVKSLLDLFYSSIDPFLLVSNWSTGTEFHVLQFLKLICCMIPNADAEEYSNCKRILYLKKFISALSACCSSKETQMLKLLHKFSDIISSLFDEIKVVICNGSVSPNEQTHFALPLIKEVLMLLNNIPESKLSVAALNSLTSWLGINTKSPLLLPCLKVSCEHLNSVSHMVTMIESCISTRFNDVTVDTHEVKGIWQMISSYFSVRSSIFDEFVRNSVEKNAFLTLYCCILHRLPHSDSRENKKILLERIFQWIKDSKLSFDAEAKFILLWDKLLELSIELVFEEEFEVVKHGLTSFCWILETLAEDRSNSGFFAIIGLGQASSLSVNFRFLCRVMVAFIKYQIPAGPNQPIRIEYTATDNLVSSSACDEGSSTSSHKSSIPVSASKALDNLKSLQEKKLYSALQSQIDYASQCVSDPKYTLSQSRELLKYFAVLLYPKHSYLFVLGT